MFKRAMYSLLIISMISGLTSSPALAAGYDGTSGNVDCSTSGTFEVVNNVVTGLLDNCLGDVVIPDGVREIAIGAFGESQGIASVTIPTSVDTIGLYALTYSEITSITVTQGNTHYKSINGVLFTANGETLLVYPGGKAGSYVMPAGVKNIAGGAFSYTVGLTSLTFSADVTSIGDYAFSDSGVSAFIVDPGNTTFSSVNGVLYDKNIETLILYPVGKSGSYVIPASVITIGSRAFRYASHLTNVSFEAGSKLTSFGSESFAGTSLAGIAIPVSATSIGDRAFGSSSLTTITFGSGSKLTTIGEEAFVNSALTSIEIPKNVTIIGVGAFSGTQHLSSLTFENESKLTSIGDFSFANSALTSITIPKSVTQIYDSAFFNTRSLTAATFETGSQLTTIGPSAFESAIHLASIVIPASVTSIGDSAFAGTTDLSSVSFASGTRLNSIGDSAFGWSSSTFGATSITSITIPASVTHIGDGAFRENRSLASVVFEPGINLTSISDQAFSHVNITNITIPASVTSIGNQAFEFSLLDTLTFETGSQLSTIGNRSFYSGFGTLSEVVIPATVTSIGEQAFSYAGALTSVTFLGNAPTMLDNQVFSDSDRYRFYAHVYVSSCASGFTADGNGRWNQLILDVGPCWVFYNSTGGSSVTFGTLDNSGRVAQAPTAPIRSGFDFMGWSATDGGSVVAFPYTPGVTNDITLYAKWTPRQYAITFNSNGGSAVASESFVTGGQITAAPASPTRSGYTFAGWSATEGGSVVAFPYTPGVTNDITLYAKWTLVPVIDAVATAKAADLAARTIAAKKKYVVKTLAKRVKVPITSTKATVVLTVSKSSKKICVMSGAKLKTLKAGKCIVTFTVQEPKSKSGKKPKAKKTVKTLVVK